MAHAMRRADRQITDDARIDRLLAEARYATIALADGDEPYVVTLSCGFDRANRRLCFHVAAAGRKLDIIARNPRACATVISDLGYKPGECAHPFQSVVMNGTMRILEEPGEVRDGMRVLVGQLETAADAEAVYQRNKLDEDAALQRFRLLVFEIEDATAKQGS
jgi:nitroimidazol reductase NimA-like FMN-containing flavoprotein (pyridoxamine 5'-phosphate oxidase superfamily)